MLHETETSGNSELESIFDDAYENPESEEQEYEMLLDSESLLEPVESGLGCVESESENATRSASNSKHTANDIKLPPNVTQIITSWALNKPNFPKSSVSILRLKRIHNELSASFKTLLASPKLSFIPMMQGL